MEGLKNTLAAAAAAAAALSGLHMNDSVSAPLGKPPTLSASCSPKLYAMGKANLSFFIKVLGFRLGLYL